MVSLNYRHLDTNLKKEKRIPDSDLEKSVEYQTQNILTLDNRDYNTGAQIEEVDTRNLPTNVKGLQTTYTGEGIAKTAVVDRYLPLGLKQKIMRHELDHAAYGSGENRADIAAGLSVRSISDPDNKSGWVVYQHLN